MSLEFSNTKINDFLKKAQKCEMKSRIFIIWYSEYHFLLSSFYQNLTTKPHFSRLLHGQSNLKLWYKYSHSLNFFLNNFDYFFQGFVNLICLDDICQKKNFFETRINNNINFLRYIQGHFLKLQHFKIRYFIKF